MAVYLLHEFKYAATFEGFVCQVLCSFYLFTYLFLFLFRLLTSARGHPIQLHNGHVSEPQYVSQIIEYIAHEPLTFNLALSPK